jgi:hypothetical protein
MLIRNLQQSWDSVGSGNKGNLTGLRHLIRNLWLRTCSPSRVGFFGRTRPCFLLNLKWLLFIWILRYLHYSENSFPSTLYWTSSNDHAVYLVLPFEIVNRISPCPVIYFFEHYANGKVIFEFDFVLIIFGPDLKFECHARNQWFPTMVEPIKWPL